MARIGSLHRTGKRARRALRSPAARRLRGRLLHLRYSWSGRWPDPDAPDTVVADRVRSVLGPLEKLLDVPHVNVTVCRRIATLHGAVTSRSDAEDLAAAAFSVPGVLGVESRLHIGLATCDTRPSTGRAQHLADVFGRSSSEE